LSDVFADYFFNEFDDPLNAYTAGMANYGGAAVALSQTNYSAAPTNHTSTTAAAMNTAKTGLPTGGIRTAFHAGAIAPAPKKPRPSEDAADPSSVAPTPLSVMMQQHQHHQMAMQQSLLYNSMQQNPAALLPQTQIAATAPQPVHIANVASSGGIALPVGVGIRLGGIGGVAPAQRFVQPAPVSGGVFAAPYGMMWNNAAGAPGGVDPSEEGLSEEAITERRQRNREHAKRSRVRKKFMLESLQEDVRALQRENNRLRMLVQEHMPEQAMQIITECCTHNPLFGDTTNSSGSGNVPSPSAGGNETGSLERSDFSLMQSLAAGQRCFVLSDPKLPDNPIVFATQDFYKLTGYTSEEVLGRNCRFLQGPGTDKRAVEVIRKAVATGSDATVCLINYKADGTPFWNQFFIAALRDSDNNIVNFVSTCLRKLAYSVTLATVLTILPLLCDVKTGWCTNGSRTGSGLGIIIRRQSKCCASIAAQRLGYRRLSLRCTVVLSNALPPSYCIVKNRHNRSLVTSSIIKTFISAV
jgi:PAS domain S-box-containing protein